MKGVIIDTFTSLTEQLQNREYDKTQFCFICGLSRDILEKNFKTNKGFVNHIKVLRKNLFLLFNLLVGPLYVELCLL